MIFLTVGTQFPFDRLTKSVDEAISEGGIEEGVFAQIGDSSYQPHNIEAVAFLEKSLFDKHIREASCIISHAGIGIMTMALEHGKPLLVMPRLRKYREVVNDHQLAIAKKFGQLGHVLVAYQEDQLLQKIRQLKSFVPQRRKTSPGKVAERIRHFLESINGR